jgi:uncharacterized protein YbjT (DUF2867 family)
MNPARSTSKSTPARSVLLAGATGLIGRELTACLLAHKPPPKLHALVRRVPQPADARVHWLQVDYARLPVLPAADEAYCCLGTTIKQAGSQAAFRAVDFDAVLAFAQAARAAGVTRLAVVSSLGASPRAAGFYSRVKGEMEAALSKLGWATLVIARPSLLAGDRAALGQPPRAAERAALLLSAPFSAFIPKGLRPIEARTVARGMVAALRQPHGGVRIVESAGLQDLGAA